MATPQIKPDSASAETFDILEGDTKPLLERSRPITLDGEDGEWSTLIGKRGEEFFLTTIIALADAAAATTKINTTYPAICSPDSKELTTITHHSGETVANVHVEAFEVIKNETSELIVSESDGGNHHLEVRWGPCRVAK